MKGLDMRELLFASTLVVAIAAVACTTPSPPAVVASTPIGSTKQAAIEVCMPGGEREYLSRLRCEDGSPPNFERVGSYGSRNPLPEAKTGESGEEYAKRVSGSSSALRGAPLKPGETDYHVVDCYRLSCKGIQSTLFMDMYHCAGKPLSVAPAGFSIVPPAPSKP